ncbi:hypothetical protein FPZ12_022250 [Amycolatopsis acidicola]|uniref:Uncharacterized protein n=1 Tax=Amycolatopsis acidicola TaxID=2596893 RepID=A0A5N0V3Z2_9PSEU|nr:hypothetical protein [Amycolatopsis acidicola]KAA9158566.1 hypothetical protein FPZ12_022250 [Amycolatopsis acidicola]
MTDDLPDPHPELLDPDWQRHAEKEAWVDYRKNRAKARRGRRLTIIAAVLVVLAGGGYAFVQWGRSTSEHYDPASSGGDGGAGVTTTPPAPTTLPDYARVDLSHPFDNTPAQAWKEGIAGLTIPPAAKTGSFSAQQVGSALDKVRHAIETATLDPEVTQQHNIEKYAKLLAPGARADVRAKPGSYTVQIADGFRLLPVSPRVNGTLTVSAGRAGELLVHADYLVAYAFDPGSERVQGPGDIEPFLRYQQDYALDSGALWLDGSHRYFLDVACGAGAEDKVAPAFSEQLVVSSLPGEPGQFDPAQPMPTGENCP